MELKHQLAGQLRQLRMSGVLETLENRNRQAIDGQWSHIEFLTRLLEDEIERRAQKQLHLRLRRATLNTAKTLEGFDFTFNPHINRQQILNLAGCDYVREKRNAVAVRPNRRWKNAFGSGSGPGSGPSGLRCAASSASRRCSPTSTAGAPMAPGSGVSSLTCARIS